MTTHTAPPPQPHTTDRALAWNNAALAGPDTLILTSPDFASGGPIPTTHAALRAGGANLSPALSWTRPPGDTAALLLIIEDPDAPTRMPYLHCLALVSPARTHLDQGALDAANPPPDVRLLRRDGGRGYLGPAPPKTHGPHRYVFELFALARELIPEWQGALDTMQPRDVLARAGNVLARGKIVGTYQRATSAAGRVEHGGDRG